MATPYLVLAALFLAAFTPSARERDVTPRHGVTIVERLRSEFLSVLEDEVGAADEVCLATGRVHPDVARAAADAESSAQVYFAKRAIEKQIGRPGLRTTLRRGSSCWWLWLLFGVELCG